MISVRVDPRMVEFHANERSNSDLAATARREANRMRTAIYDSWLMSYFGRPTTTPRDSEMLRGRNRFQPERG